MTDRLGVPKNSAFVDESLEIYNELGYDVSGVDTDSREYCQQSGDTEFYVMRAQDIPRALDNGWIDYGVTGEDLLNEYCLGEDVPVPCYGELGFGEADIWLAAPEALDENPTVATSFPEVAEEYLDQNFSSYEVLEVEGSVEVFPEFGDVDAVIEVVDSGRTLRENGLEKLDFVMSSEAVLVDSGAFDAEVLKNPVQNQLTGGFKK